MTDLVQLAQDNKAELLIIAGLCALYYVKHTQPRFTDTNFIMYAGGIIFLYYLYKNQQNKEVKELASGSPSTLGSGLPPFK